MAGITRDNSRTPLVNNPRKHASRYDLQRSVRAVGQGVHTRCDEEERATAKPDAAGWMTTRLTQRLSAKVTGTPHVTESNGEGDFALLQSTHGSLTANPSRATQKPVHTAAHAAARDTSETRRIPTHTNKCTETTWYKITGAPYTGAQRRGGGGERRAGRNRGRCRAVCWCVFRPL